jgi:hypothetical protein
MNASPTSVTAVVVTFRRRNIAGALVRSLVSEEGLEPSRIVVVVNGDGGLDDRDLESQVKVVRLPQNLGPAGGFRVGMLEAFSDPSTKWAYLCEDDVGLFDLPLPRVDGVLARVEALADRRPPVGAVVAYGRRFVADRGHAVNFVPAPGEAQDLSEVDVAAWGATLLSREVFEAGILPDAEMFFGYEDFDFFCRVRESGFSVMVDGVSARRIAPQQTTAGRDDAVASARPTDKDEPWRAYYLARNFFTLARRHGTRRWIAWHLAYSLRRVQLAGDRRYATATLRGLLDGFRGRLGIDPGYLRDVGELAQAP